MPLQLHNTLTKTTELFVAQHEHHVSLYTCGPTVYNYLHVGNWAAYIYWDTLVRTLHANNYTVERVMNITDVGHLTSDEDEGEDKLQKGARREGKTAWEVARYYGDDFLRGMGRLNLITPQHITKATDFIEEQLALVRRLKEGGHTYQIDDGIYFDTATFPRYADFAHLDIAAQQAGARVEFNAEKRQSSDFALWKFSPADEQRDMEWDTPSDLIDDGVPRKGFPGWHLECSAMAMSILGETLDIHTGGIDHIPVHHTNEIAQSEAATGVQFSRYWLHNNHLKSNGTKISKSLGNGYTLDELEQHDISPLDYRLFVLQSHYRSEGNFTFENVTAAKHRRLRWRNAAALRHQIYPSVDTVSANESVLFSAAAGTVLEALNDDLNTSEALTLADEAFHRAEKIAHSRIDRATYVSFLEQLDELFGLDLLTTTPDISDQQKQRLLERTRAREAKDWVLSDAIRDEFLAAGLSIRDTPHGAIWEYET